MATTVTSSGQCLRGPIAQSQATWQGSPQQPLNPESGNHLPDFSLSRHPNGIKSVPVGSLRAQQLTTLIDELVKQQQQRASSLSSSSSAPSLSNRAISAPDTRMKSESSSASSSSSSALSSLNLSAPDTVMQLEPSLALDSSSLVDKPKLEPDTRVVDLTSASPSEFRERMGLLRESIFTNYPRVNSVNPPRLLPNYNSVPFGHPNFHSNQRSYSH